MQLANLKRDTPTIESGTWIDEIPGMGNLRLKVRGLTSRAFQTAYGRLSRAVPKDERQRDGTLSPDAAVRVMGEAIHEAVLLDWDGLSNGEDPQPYDAEMAKTLLTSPDYRPFVDAVAWACSVVDNGRTEAMETLSKNLKPSPAGS